MNKIKSKTIEIIPGAGPDAKDYTIWDNDNYFYGLVCYNNELDEWILSPIEDRDWTIQNLKDIINCIEQLKGKLKCPNQIVNATKN